MKRYKWVIGICDTEQDGVSFEFVIGNEDEAKKRLFSLIVEDRRYHDDDDFDGGTETIDEVYRPISNVVEWYGFNNYHFGHTDFTLKLVDDIPCTDFGEDDEIRISLNDDDKFVDVWQSER